MPSRVRSANLIEPQAAHLQLSQQLDDVGVEACRTRGWCRSWSSLRSTLEAAPLDARDGNHSVSWVEADDDRSAEEVPGAPDVVLDPLAGGEVGPAQQPEDSRP